MAVRDVVQAAAGVGGGSEYVEDVFSTYLYTGNGSTQTITNGIDLDGEGGLVWIKGRDDGAHSHCLYDTERGVTKQLNTNYNSPENVTSSSPTQDFVSFNSNGFSLGEPWNTGNLNSTAMTKITSWSFRKSPKFFDVVTWTGDGNAGRTIAHNLGSVPGCIIVKSTSNSTNWVTYHRSTGASQSLYLNRTDEAAGNDGWNYTAPTSTEFTVGSYITNNASGYTYVAYLFAHNAGGFGDDGEQNVISCGSFTTGAGGVSSVNLGYEPQFILFKNTVSSENWMLFDTFRGLPAPGTSTGRQQLKPNLADEEGSNNYASVTSTGFDTQNLYSSEAYIYIAIRRGPMKTPEAGTEVFAPSYFAGDGSTSRLLNVGFPTDLFLGKRAIGDPSAFVDRMRGKNKQLFTGGAYAENTGTDYCRFDSNSGPIIGYNSGGININSSAYSYRSYSFKRSSSFMDVLAYKGNSSSQDLAHNLNAIPELVMVKSRTSSYDWYVWATGFSSFQALKLNSDIAKASYGTIWGFASPPVTETTLSLGGDYYANSSSSDYSAYLFASCPNVSKVGTYVGNASSLNIDCGFSTGARLVLIKRIDATGDWYLWDSVRGISFSNDAFILLNSFDGENNSYNYISPLASGFTVRSTAPAALNASGGSYLFLAIA
jgi:hypothetical protein